jgi:hypothetical protein
VAKRKADPYRPERVCYKIKSRTYTQGEGRWECSSGSDLRFAKRDRVVAPLKGA